MSQYASVPPPPPPPPSIAPPPTGAPPRGRPPTTPLQRRLIQLPTITTSLVGLDALASATPSTAIMNSPFTNYPPASALSPVVMARNNSPMAHRAASGPPVAYNPQEWGRGAQTSGQFMVTPRTVERPSSLSGMELAMPSPPPPYSPGHPSQTHSPVIQPSPAMQSNAFTPIQSASPTPFSDSTRPMSTASSRLISSPIPSSAPSFPPPPPRDRSASRNRLWNLPSLGRHRPSDMQSTTPPNAIDSLRQNTSDVLARTPITGPQPPSYQESAHPDREPANAFPDLPPAARRSASASAVHLSTPTSHRPERDFQVSTPIWEPGMPLPPPPPGPPPSSSRSQSLSRVSDRSYSSSQESLSLNTVAHVRRGAAQPSLLEPVPATPANWVDEDSGNRSRSPAARGLHIDTGSQQPVHAIPQPIMASIATAAVQSPGGLTRSYPKRETSARGIRERRSESRAARERNVSEEYQPATVHNEVALPDVDTTSKPADLVLNLPNSAELSRRKAVKVTSPRNNRSSMIGDSLQDSAKAKKHYGDLLSSGSAGSSKRPTSSRNITSPQMDTPPFSPATEAADGFYRSSGSVPPKALPTPPHHRSSEEYLAKAANFGSYSPKRPVSHILHTPNDDDSTPSLLPGSATRLNHPNSPVPNNKASEQEAFANLAIERHHAFIARENVASSDQERLELFAQFIVTESRLRRDRYSSAFDLMAGDIMDLTRDLWKAYASGRRSTTPTASSSRPDDDTSQESNIVDHQTSLRSSAPSPASSRTNFTPRTEPPDSPGSIMGPDSAREKPHPTFQPCLSPILSMRASTANDIGDGESRGRPPSRWWEQSADGSQGRAGGKIVRSKRESKFMAEDRFNLQYQGEASPRSFAGPSTPAPASQPPLVYSSYGTNEYPPEKVGWHEDQVTSPNYRSLPATPNPHLLDISRLITLPPPYPRHHPAVNNNHPDLAPIRNNHRTITETDDPQNTRDWFQQRLHAMRDQRLADADERKRKLRHSVQQQVQSGTMSYADAAAAEATFTANELQLSQADAKVEFDMFEKDVSSPLVALFSERVTKATACIDQLSASLPSSPGDSTVNEPQEEGDETPELLERLTLLKWLFEAREVCHKELFSLESERNERYKKVVLTPYRSSGMEHKAAEVEAFFTQDALESQRTFETAAQKRYESFTAMMERNVARGVEDQLSAFWDIAPGLLETVQKVPENLKSAIKAGFGINVPVSEYADNPSYQEHPLQYLYTLLGHAEKSAYQHVEAQTNLMCLLNEVKSQSLSASTRCLAVQRCVAGENKEVVETEMAEVRKVEERKLIADLRERVGLVESQWKQALGDGLQCCKARVRDYLTASQGWDESLEEEV